ncbi:MAG TPA: HAD-IC family P-type ATPase [Candidatus Faecaligallichristensenella faecipullorum]|nr:HAD-IC family P-type ATPase [Candidatus Faecaligallichristensenella faecipullorum]
MESGKTGRFRPDAHQGLSEAQVRARVEAGLTNQTSRAPGKTTAQILRGNLMTLFNLLNLVLAILVISVGSYKNALFMIVIILNAVIGTVQELRAKKTVEKLSVISAPTALAVRSGREVKLGVSELVLDDVMVLKSGMQICADGVVLEGEIEVNESLLTGESDPILKRPGDGLMSGSFVVSGRANARVDKVGDDNYAAQLTRDAQRLKKPNSELMKSLNALIRVISVVILPLGAALFIKSRFILHESLQDGVVSTVAAMVGMIPEGLILLTSVALAVGVIRLAQRKTLVQELYCMETLARVDVLCLDKTGTITEGSMEVQGIIPLAAPEDQVRTDMGILASAMQDDNPTFAALRAAFPPIQGSAPLKVVPFSSARKWSGARFEKLGSLVLGAGEFVLGADYQSIRGRVEECAQKGQRVLVLAQSDQDFQGEQGLPQGLKPLALLTLADKIRPEAAGTLRFFAEQDVDLRVISGDNPKTVAAVAGRAGLKDAQLCVDASTLKTEEQIRQAAARYKVFGRVTPEQKCKLVRALKAQGHVVAMTGDGVNDVPALKEADCSVAMASGSDAARQVAQLVLLDNNFASMPHVVLEGRRVINNIRRSASLFLTKTLFSFLLAIISLIFGAGYPFEPIQLTLFSTITIGIPSFFLALEPNRARIQGKFLQTVIRQAAPGALCIVLGVQALTALATGTPEQLSTMATLYAVLVGLIVLFRVCMPFNRNRVVLFAGCCVLFVGAICLLPVWFSLAALERNHVLMVLGAAVVGGLALPLLSKGVDALDRALEKKLADK